MIDLNKSVVLSGGLVNLEATLVKVAEAVSAYNETQSNDLDTVGAAVHALFDKHVGAFIQVPAVATIAVGSLNLTSLDAIAAMGDRVKDYLKANSGPGGAFEVRKGRGVSRIADQADADRKATK